MIPQFLQENQFASGLLLTTILAACLAYMRNLPLRLWNWLWSQFAVCAEVKNSDPSFNWISMWLDQQPYSKKVRRLTLYTYHKDDDDDDDDIFVDSPTARRKKNRPRVLFTPSAGDHIFWYKGRLVWLSRAKSEATPNNGSLPGMLPERESFHIWVLGRDQAIIRDIVNDAMALALPDGVPETCVIPSSDGRWQSAIHRRPRSTASVILEEGVINSLVEDAKKFLKNKLWYDEMGIPYRRGYLLHGVPGSGKTSAVLAIAGELGLDVYMLNLGDRYLDDGRLNYLLAQVPPGNVVLLEDIDAAFQQRQVGPDVEPASGRGRQSSKRDMDLASITFSGLLNALDGVAAREGRVLFMTTNHKEKLDAALIRPGRADMHVEFGYATPHQAARMFCRFFPGANPGMVEEFGRKTMPGVVSMATVQDHLLGHKNDPAAALIAWNLENQRAQN